jgi:uncharacterized protein with PQ loop repeat
MIIEIFGWIGAILLPACAIPQIWKIYKTKSVEDISLLYLWLWFIGEVSILFYALFSIKNWPLLFNYIISFFIISILIIQYNIYKNKNKNY